jgi:RNAse (barnase) inhibitor barstar
MNDDDFEFGDSSMADDADTVRVSIPETVSSALELMQIIAKELRFPAYFGQNWSALFDCLCDLSWLDKRRVIIAHESVPNITEQHLREYLRVLRDAVDSWRADPDQHELLVFFPIGTKLPD